MKQLKKITHIGFFLISLFLIICSQGCSAKSLGKNLKYVVRASNFGTNGVMLIKPSLIDINGETTNNWRGIRPQFPTTQPDRYFQALDQYPTSLPKEIAVVWQLAELTNCKSVDHAKAFPKNVRKTGCKWRAIEGKVYRRNVNLDQVRNSPAYKRTGKPVKGSYLYGQYTLNINLIFNEDKLTVKTTNGQSRGFGQ